MFQFFVKQYSNQVGSWIAEDSDLWSVHQRLLLICDDEGVLNYDYPMISRLINMPIEVVIEKMEILQKPNGRSRDPSYEGRTLVRLDPNRPWGWRFVNYKKYRKLRDPNERRMYKNTWQNEKRRRQRDEKRQNVSTNAAGAPDKRQETTREDKTGPVAREDEDSGGQTLEAEDKRGPNQNKIKKVPPAVPQGGPQETESLDQIFPRNAVERYRLQLVKEKKRVEDYVLDWEEAKALICQKILGGKDPRRPWSYQAMHDLARQMPIPRLEIDRIGWFRGLPDDGTPELSARKKITEAGLMAFWSDEFTRANTFYQELYGWKEKVRREKEAAK